MYPAIFQQTTWSSRNREPSTSPWSSRPDSATNTPQLRYCRIGGMLYSTQGPGIVTALWCGSLRVWDLKMAAVGDRRSFKTHLAGHKWPMDQRDTVEIPSLDKLAGFRVKNNPNKYTLNTKTSEIWWSKRLYRYFPVGMDYRIVMLFGQEFRDFSQIFGSTILERPFSDSNEMWKHPSKAGLCRWFRARIEGRSRGVGNFWSQDISGRSDIKGDGLKTSIRDGINCINILTFFWKIRYKIIFYQIYLY